MLPSPRAPSPPPKLGSGGAARAPAAPISGHRRPCRCSLRTSVFAFVTIVVLQYAIVAVVHVVRGRD